MKRSINGWLFLIAVTMLALPIISLAQTEPNVWQGLVEALPEGKIGMWTIGQTPFEASVETVFDETNGLIELGSCVTVTYNLVAGVNQVVAITQLSVDQCIVQSTPIIGTTPTVIEATPTALILDSVSLSGFVELRPNENLGAWVVNGVALEANNETIFILDNGPAEIGSCITIDYVPVGTTNIVIRLQTELVEMCGLPAVTPTVSALETTWRGSVVLQGRSDYSGVEIFLSESLCDTAIFDQPTTLTDENGQFQVITTDIIYQCVRASYPGYLAQQQLITTPDIAPLQLLAGDVNGDGIINILDIAVLAKSYETDNPQADINGDGIVDILDIVHAAGNYQR